jgi:hypothetical protein
VGVPDDPFDPKLKQWIAWAARLAAEVALAAISRVGCYLPRARSRP